MNRRDLLKNTAALGFATTISTLGILARPVVAEARAVREQPPEKASSQAPPATKDKKLCPVCGMKGDPAITSVYKGQKYFFCMQDHKLTFDDAPEDFV